MNFNIYLNKALGEKVSKVAHELHRSRNSIIQEALEEWIGKHLQPQWPKNFFNFSPIEEVPDFKALRNDLAKLDDSDPLL